MYLDKISDAIAKRSSHVYEENFEVDEGSEYRDAGFALTDCRDSGHAGKVGYSVRFIGLRLFGAKFSFNIWREILILGLWVEGVFFVFSKTYCMRLFQDAFGLSRS